MSYVKNGVNIMKNISNTKKYFVCLFILSILFMSCSKDTDKKTDSSDETENVIVDSSNIRPELLTVKDTIEAGLSDAMERLRYYDNSGLYENEFSYITDASTFDEYLTFAEISFRPPGEVIKLEVDSLNMFAHDSAAAWATVTLDFSGNIQVMNEQLLVVYYKNGKWIKPTRGVIKNQLEYEELIRQAEEAAKWENE